MGPLDAAAVTQLKADTTAVAVTTLHLLTATGVDATSVTGQWLSCDDARPDFGQYSVAARIAIAPGKPESQLDPMIAPLLADGWTVRRDTATSRQSATDGNALATLHKDAVALEITTTGGKEGLVSMYGRCVNSPVFNNDGFNFDTDKDSIPLG